ncbi:TPA: GNAT family N-acetyltransferase [Legionella bozemanae]|uniref:GNAT family N-acetyltransferase n=1 Tax=Legionella bozemanae TaxID=447 RepID=UPI001040E192|nr:GNAT family N-acetyltransferase [Legionella bozemanae]
MTTKIPDSGNVQIICGKEQLNLLDKVSALRKRVWPDFLRLADEIVFKMYELYPDFQISLLDDNKELIGIANSIPLIWEKPLFALSDEGVSWVVNTGLYEKYPIESTNLLCAISITVSDTHRNKGLSKMLLQYLKNSAWKRNFISLVIPVRPSLKSIYPLIPIDEYVMWQNKDGLIFDPWIKTHLNLGARIVKICHRSACVTASSSQWEEWAGMHFPGDGDYVVKDALAPVKFVNDIGTYVEPNLWVYYPND